MSEKPISYQALLEEVVMAAREAAQEAQGGGDDLFERGRVMAYYDVLDVIKEQAELLGIDLDEIGLGRFDPDSLLHKSEAA